MDWASDMGTQARQRAAGRQKNEALSVVVSPAGVGATLNGLKQALRLGGKSLYFEY